MQIILILALVIVLAIALFVYLVTRPIFTSPTLVKLDVAVSPAQLREDVEYMTHSFVPRDGMYPENLYKLAKYLEKRFTEAGARVELQEYDISSRKYYNVIASYGPQEGERLVIGAHYDTCCEMPGADDNTSGVAGLLALASLLKNTTLKKCLDIVAFTLEEPPYFRTLGMGSAQHAKKLADEKIKVSLMIAVEMIGYFTDKPDTQDYPVSALKLLYPTTGNFIAVVGRFNEGSITRDIKSKLSAASTLPVYSINAPAFLPGIDFSDHLNYWQHGFPAVMLTDTAFYRNKNYHTTMDTPDTLDYDRMAEVVRGLYYFVTSRANGL